MKIGASRIVTIISVALLAGVAILGFVLFQNKNKLDPAAQQAIEHANCAAAKDKEVCRFLAVWQSGQDYTLNATENKNDKPTNFNLVNSGDDFHLTVESDQPRQTVGVNGTIYGLIGGKWYQQELEDKTKKSEYRESSQLSFLNKNNVDNFNLAGEEKCLQANCLRYEVNGQENSITVWFDKQNYNLHRVLVRNDSGYSYNAILGYDNPLEVTAPGDARKVIAGQQILPGGTQVSAAQTNSPSESSTNSLPATGDSGDPEEYRQWLSQRQ
jgi:hypothetical protein